MIQFFVPGVPKPGGSKKAFFRPGMKYPVIVDAAGEANRDWKATVRQVAADAMKKANLEPAKGPLKLIIEFRLLRPRAHYGSGKNENKIKPSAPRFPAKMPDATKLLRSTEDAMKHIVWHDDAQVVVQFVSKVYDDTTGAYIVVDRLPEFYEEE